ncbi:DUF986 family protein [Salmonella enterica subsp. enterica]|nr:DUF986 family protein [Salmonella enterica subsp. enterica]
MTIHSGLVLILFIAALLLAYALYDQFIMPRRNGPSAFYEPAPPRSRRQRYQYKIGLVAILIYNNVTSHGRQMTTWLLSALALMGFYILPDPHATEPSLNNVAFLRQCLDRITVLKEMNLSEDGVLVMQ